MRTGLTIAALLSAVLAQAACLPPIERAEVGEAPGHIHVVDARTGKCVLLESGRYGRMLVEPPDRCARVAP